MASGSTGTASDRQVSNPPAELKQAVFLSLVRHCQWDQVLEAVDQGVATEQRDLAIGRAVQQGQWWLVSHLLQLGVHQHERDNAALAAARHQQWDCLQHLLCVGISADCRDHVLREAVCHSQWTLLSHCIPLGIKPDTMEILVTKALQEDQWDVVMQVLRFSLEKTLVTSICQEMVSKQQWKYVPSLVEVTKEAHIMDFVLQASIRSCRWECIMKLIQIGLTPAQQKLVCQEALEFNHFDCAIELLRQGICNDSAQRILSEAIKWNKCHLLTDLLKESRTGRALHDAIRRAAKDCMLSDTVSVDVYLKLLEASGPTETELRSVIKEGLDDFSILRIFPQLVTVFKSARRLIKQIFLTSTDIDSDILPVLLWDQDRDLTLHLYVGQQIWSSVVSGYGDPQLSARARRFALTQAISRQAWTAVQKMSAMGVTSDCQRRYAFLQAARLGEWQTALAISDQVASLDHRDKVFAVRMWCSLGLWQCVNSVLDTWFSHQVAQCILEESVIGGQYEVFVKICEAVDCDIFDKTSIFKTALAHKRDSFVLEFCQCMANEHTLIEMIHLALQEARWDLVKELLEQRQHIIDTENSEDYPFKNQFEVRLLLACIKGIVHFEEAWETVVPQINALCKQCLLDTEIHEHNPLFLGLKQVSKEATHLLDYCLEVPHDYAALLLSAFSKSECSVKRALRVVQPEEIDTSVFCTLFRIAIILEYWGSSALFIQYVSTMQVSEAVDEIMTVHGCDALLLKCREKGLFQWATWITACKGYWDRVCDDLVFCKDTDIVDAVIERASCQDEWEIVLALLPRCSQDHTQLLQLLRYAIYSGHSECCEKLIDKVNLSSKDDEAPLLYVAVTSSGDREAMVKLCIRAGLSTLVEMWTNNGFGRDFSPMSKALLNGQLPLVKLLYRAGACSISELQQYKNDNRLRAQLKHKKRQDIIDYIDFMATTPRSLQDLCRQTVSHCIGCQPSRPQRVASLQLPQVVCEFVNFADVLSS